MKFTFVPEYRFDTFDMASAEFLSKIGIKGIILDIDNTLEPYEHANPEEHVIAWLNSLKECGIKAAIHSCLHRSTRSLSPSPDKGALPRIIQAL